MDTSIPYTAKQIFDLSWTLWTRNYRESLTNNNTPNMNISQNLVRTLQNNVNTVLILCQEHGIEKIYLSIYRSEVYGYLRFSDFFVSKASGTEDSSLIENLLQYTEGILCRVEVHRQIYLETLKEANYGSIVGDWVWDIAENELARVESVPLWVPQSFSTKSVTYLETKIAFPTGSIFRYFVKKFETTLMASGDQVILVEDQDGLIIRLLHIASYDPYQVITEELESKQDSGEEWCLFKKKWESRYLKIQRIQHLNSHH